MLSIEYNDEKGLASVCLCVRVRCTVQYIIYKREMGTQWLKIFFTNENNNNNNTVIMDNSISICKLYEMLFISVEMMNDITLRGWNSLMDYLQFLVRWQLSCKWILVCS